MEIVASHLINTEVFHYEQIQLYNNMVAKEGTPEEEEARKAYRAAREDSDHAAEVASESRVSSALIERVRLSGLSYYDKRECLFASAWTLWNVILRGPTDAQFNLYGA